MEFGLDFLCIFLDLCLFDFMFFPARGAGLTMLFWGLVVPAIAPEAGALPELVIEELPICMLELPMLELLLVPAVGAGLTALFCGFVVPGGSLAEADAGACAIATPPANSKTAKGIALTSVFLNMKIPFYPKGLT